MDPLYREYILDHYKNPRNFGELPEPDAEFEDRNPLCGDEMGVQIKLDGDRIEDVRFHGQGCAISQATASIISDELKGKLPEPAEAPKATNVVNLMDALRQSPGSPAFEQGDRSVSRGELLDLIGRLVGAMRRAGLGPGRGIAVHLAVSPEAFAAFLETQNPDQRAWLTSGNAGGPGLYSIRQFQDAPGGEIKGYELSYQQDLTFLPWYFENLGVQANFTKLSSELSYILDPGEPGVRPQITRDGPFLGASPESANFTVYYDTEKWSARVSLAYRSGYVTTYPIAAGTCAPGVCTTPLMNDFIGSKSTRNVDASMTYSLNEHFTLSLEGLNLTNQAEERWVYQNDPLAAQYSNPGRQFFAGFRYQY